MQQTEKFISGTVQSFKYRQQHLITHNLVLQAARDLREQNFWQTTNQVCDLVKKHGHTCTPHSDSRAILLHVINDLQEF